MPSPTSFLEEPQSAKIEKQPNWHSWDRINRRFIYIYIYNKIQLFLFFSNIKKTLAIKFVKTKWQPHFKNVSWLHPTVNHAFLSEKKKKKNNQSRFWEQSHVLPTGVKELQPYGEEVVVHEARIDGEEASARWWGNEKAGSEELTNLLEVRLL